MMHKNYDYWKTTEEQPYMEPPIASDEQAEYHTCKRCGDQEEVLYYGVCEFCIDEGSV